MHTIRLKHPWTCELVDGQAVWRRSFNWPPGSVTEEILWLVIEPLPAEAQVTVNGRLLILGASPNRFDISDMINVDCGFDVI